MLLSLFSTSDLPAPCQGPKLRNFSTGESPLTSPVLTRVRFLVWLLLRVGELQSGEEAGRAEKRRNRTEQPFGRARAHRFGDGRHGDRTQQSVRLEQGGSGQGPGPAV